jgi:hypothetical protein
MTNPTTLDDLRAAFPGWEFATIWITVPSGPDRSHIVAHGADVTLSGWTVAGVAEAIRNYEREQR